METFDHFDSFPLKCRESLPHPSHQSYLPSNPLRRLELMDHDPGLAYELSGRKEKKMTDDTRTHQNPLTESSKATHHLGDVSIRPAEELSEEQLGQIAGGITGSDGGVGEVVSDNNEDGTIDA
jgi:hypothetical protein